MKYVTIKAEWRTPEGFYKRPKGDIAKGLKKGSKDLKQAMGRLNFYINRFGTNLSFKELKNLEDVKPMLRKAFGK